MFEELNRAFGCRVPYHRTAIRNQDATILYKHMNEGNTMRYNSFVLILNTANSLIINKHATYKRGSRSLPLCLSIYMYTYTCIGAMLVIRGLGVTREKGLITNQGILIPRGPGTAHLRTLVPKVIPGIVFATSP